MTLDANYFCTKTVIKHTLMNTAITTVEIQTTSYRSDAIAISAIGTRASAANSSHGGYFKKCHHGHQALFAVVAPHRPRHKDIMLRNQKPYQTGYLHQRLQFANELKTFFTTLARKSAQATSHLDSPMNTQTIHPTMDT